MDDPLQEEVTSDHVDQLVRYIQENAVDEEYYQTTQTSRVQRNRSEPRKWEISRTTHYIPNFEKGFQPKREYNHKTPPLTIFDKFFS